MATESERSDLLNIEDFEALNNFYIGMYIVKEVMI